MNKFLFIVPLFLPAAAFAGGGIGTNNVKPELRTQKFCIDNYQAVADADVTAGSNGVIAVPALHNQQSGFAQTSSIAALLWPSRIQVTIIDVTDSGALTCTNVVVKGFDQFGKPISETLASISETASYTTKVYERVTSVSGGNCNAQYLTTHSGDLVQFRASPYVGLPFHITPYSDQVLQVCVFDASASSGTWVCMKPGTADGTLTFDRTGSGDRVNEVYSYIDLTGNIIGNAAALADDDDICITVRAP